MREQFIFILSEIQDVSRETTRFLFHVERISRFTWNAAIYGPAIDYLVPMRSDLLSEPGILASARQFQESSFAIFAPSSSPIQ